MTEKESVHSIKRMYAQSMSTRDIILRLNLSTDIKDIAEVLLVLLVISNLFFQSVDEDSCCRIIWMVFQESLHGRLHWLIIILRPTGFGKNEMGVWLIASC